MIVIDANNLILGRLASFAAKKVLLGEEVRIVNCEKAVISGDKKYTLQKYKLKFDKGVPLKGPYFPRTPDRIVRRAVRGMLPFKRARGREAYKKVMCYAGMPEGLKEKPITLKEADASKLPTAKFIAIKKISEHLGVKL